MKGGGNTAEWADYPGQYSIVADAPSFSKACSRVGCLDGEFSSEATYEGISSLTAYFRCSTFGTTLITQTMSLGGKHKDGRY